MGLLGIFNKNKKSQTRGNNYQKKKKTEETPTCPYCRSKGVLNEKKTKWECPNCEDVSVSTYNGSTKAMGIMADTETRQWRIRVHEELKFKWDRGDSKQDYYGWISETLRKGNAPSTIANLNLDECRKVIKEGRKELYQAQYKHIFEHNK